MQKRAFAASLPYYEKALKTSSSNTEAFLTTRNGLGRAMSFLKPRAESEKYLLENVQLCQKKGEQSSFYSTALHNLGTFYLPVGVGNLPEMSEKYLKEAATLRKQNLGEKHLDYANTLNSLAILYRSLGKYSLSEQMYRESADIRKTALGPNHPEYLITLNNWAVLNVDMRNYDLAEDLYIKVLAAREKVLGPKHPDYAASLNNLAVLYNLSKKHSLAIETYQKSSLVSKEAFGEKRPEYASVLNNLALLYYELGRYHAAEELLKQALKIRKEALGSKHPDYAASLNNLALLRRETGHYKEALALSKESLGIYEAIFGKKHASYAQVLNTMAAMYGLANQSDSSWVMHQAAKDWALMQVLVQFPALTEAQKESFYFLKLKKYLRDYNTYAFSQNPKLYSGFLYDFQLSTKALLMQSAQKSRKRILASGDSTLVAQYGKWLDIKYQTIRALELGNEERKKRNIHLDSLLETTEILEKQLIQKSQAFEKLTEHKTVRWQDVQAKLKTGQAAVEMVRFKKFGVVKTVQDTSGGRSAEYPFYAYTDSVFYAALIIKKNSSQPEVVLLNNGKELEDKYLKYYQNSIENELADENSYREFWQPIAEALGNTKKIFFSPDGVYAQLSLNVLQNPKTKKYIFEELEVHTVTNTKDLLGFGKQSNPNKTASLLGFPLYDLNKADAQGLASVNRRALSDDERALTANFQSVQLLPGTKTEIETIGSTLIANNYDLTVNISELASEENIKKVNNPKILHIATHGFFIDEQNEQTNPMLRSGLLLAGCTNYAQAKNKPDTEDGVLTAAEAMNLNLDQTDLVVLSACETGLGASQAGEGVYGLQRAFCIAGAKTVVMSMWKVDDVVTQKLMTSFYAHYAQSGLVREAFRKAQDEVRKKYPQPYYWGAFVMTGE